MKKILFILIITTIVVVPTKANCRQTYMNVCEKYGDKYEISPHVLNAICYVESNYDPNASSSAGAVGICQQIPRYCRNYMNELELNDLTDPEQSIHLCARILSEYRDKGYEISDALTCYNRGESGAQKYIGTYTNYAKKVLDKSYELEHMND